MFLQFNVIMIAKEQSRPTLLSYIVFIIISAILVASVTITIRTYSTNYALAQGNSINNNRNSDKDDLANTITGNTIETQPEQSNNGIAKGTGENNGRALENLTRQDLDPILNNLFTARGELVQNNSPLAFDALNAATSKLFNLTRIFEATDNQGTVEQLKRLLSKIEGSRDALLRNNNITKAVLNLNAADTEFIKLTLRLS